MAPRSISSVPRRGLLLAVAGFSALSAIGGGAEMLVWPHGSPYLPLTLLAPTPFRSFLVPGLLLGGIVGGTSALCGVAVALRSRFARDATLLAGGALTVWIVAEMALLRELHSLHGVYGALGLTLSALGLAPGWPPEPRVRWVVAVTIAEALGLLAPAAVGLATSALPDALRAVAFALVGGATAVAVLGASHPRRASTCRGHDGWGRRSSRGSWRSPWPLSPPPSWTPPRPWRPRSRSGAA